MSNLREVKTIIYLITNTRTGKMYVGITRQVLRRRWRGHVHQARRGTRTALSAAIRKYGEQAFVLEHLATCLSRGVAGASETELIRQHATKAPSGYNLTDGGDGVIGLPREIVERTAKQNTGRKHTDEARRLIGLAGLGRTTAPAARAAISRARKGKPLSPNHREKLSAAKLGRKLPTRTDQHRAKISEGLRRAHARRKGADDGRILQ